MMNLLSHFNTLFATSYGVALITGQRGGGVVIGQTLGGAFVVLTGQADNGKMVFYDKNTLMITGDAPNAERGEFGV